jgi:hypothetical protein
MSSRRIHGRGAALAAMVLVLMTGCGDEEKAGTDSSSGPEPTTYAVVADRAAFDTTRTEVDDVFREASEVANEALGGEGVRGDTTASDTLCNEAYPRRFSRLEGGVTFVAPAASLSAALQTVSDAWKQRGWEVELAEPDRARLSTTTSTGVPFGVEVSLQVNQGDAGTLGAGLSLSTRCLKLPDDVADTL